MENENYKHPTTRLRLKDDELELINKYRRIKEESKAAGINPDDVKHGWLKTDKSSLFFKNPNFKTEEKNEFAKKLIEDLQQFSPKYPEIKRTKSEDGHLLVIDPADIHIGKLCSILETGKEYNCQIAVKQVKEGAQGILDKSSGFNIDKINFIAGNDILHTDNAKSSTTAGTHQDQDGMWYDNFLHAKKLYVDVLEMLIQVADVHFTFNPSNHDYMTGFFLADVIKTHFRHCKNITFDCSIAHRKYFKYFNNLIGTTHGDGAKNADLPLLMATERPILWSETTFRYVYTHHVHHKNAKDYIGVTVESLRSPSPADSWHDRNGYTSKQAIEGFIHHKTDGQIARLTHYFT